MQTLYVYIDSSDLGRIESGLIEAFSRFEQETGIGNVTVVNDRSTNTDGLRPGDLPDWHLGINAKYDQLDRTQVDRMVDFLVTLAQATSEEFVIGIWSNEKEIAHDLYWVDKAGGNAGREILYDAFAPI